MDYEKLKCPVCEEQFKSGDDIVVCPECGTPHHRQCYELKGSCFFEDKHNDGFNYSEDYCQNEEQDTQADKDNNTTECPRCKAQNPKESFYCGKCGFPMGMSNAQNNQQQNASNFYNPLDPMAGVNPEYKLSDDVTAGEASKFAQKSTQYFSRVFYNIKEFGKSRFNFCAFIFSGGYLLYRKMYKIGTVLTVIMGLLLVASAYFNIAYNVSYDFVMEYNKIIESASAITYNDMMMFYQQAFFKLDPIQQVLLILDILFSVANFALKIVIGIKANRWYFNHTVKEISKIKKSGTTSVQETIETKGGVNFALAISLMVVYIVINYLPSFIA